MTSMVFPWPDHRLSSNGRGDRRALTAVRRQAREEGVLAALAAGISLPSGPLEMTLIFKPPDNRRRDLLNLAEDMKSVIDGIFETAGRDDSEIRRVVIAHGSRVEGGEVYVWIQKWIGDAEV